MIIQCSECQARYMVPDHAIGVGGRTVRCAKCSHSWFVATPATAVEKPAADSNKARPLAPGSNLPAIKYPTVPAGVKASVFGLLAAVLALFVLHEWPQAFGYPPSKGFGLAEVALLARVDEQSVDGKKLIYEINGKILNMGEETREVPTLRITVADGQGNPLQYWDFSEEGRTLESKKNIPFSTGPLDIRFNKPSHFIVELGSPLELALRKNTE